MATRRDSDPTTRAYCGAMTRAVLLAAGLLTVAACSSGGDAEPPPPLETEAPTTTVEPPPTEAPEATTTTVAESTTTTAPDTTTTEVPPTDPPTTDPVDTVDPEVVAEIDAVVAEAFVAYEETWLLLQTAFEDPGDEAIREMLSQRYAEGSGKSVFDALNEFVEKNEVSLAPAPESGQGVELVPSVRGATDISAIFQTCETFTSDIVNADTGEATYEGVDSTRREIQMILEDGEWLVLRTTALESFEGKSCE